MTAYVILHPFSVESAVLILGNFNVFVNMGAIRKEFLVSHYPETFQHGANIRGETYPIPDSVSLLLGILQMVQLACLAVALLGEGIFRWIPGLGQTPAWYYNARENPMLWLALIFFIIPSMINSMAVSGAFEVELDGSIPVFSKLETGRMPNGNDILIALQKAGLDRR